MIIAYELKLPLSEVWQMSNEDVGWWLAFFKYKNELEEKAIKKNK